jgi:hypothetical protein
MQSFQANDNVTLKYIDTGAFNSQEKEKPWLVLVRCVIVSLFRTFNLIVTLVVYNDSEELGRTL